MCCGRPCLYYAERVDGLPLRMRCHKHREGHIAIHCYTMFVLLPPSFSSLLSGHAFKLNHSVKHSLSHLHWMDVFDQYLTSGFDEDEVDCGPLGAELLVGRLTWRKLKQRRNQRCLTTYILIQTANHLLKEGHVREDDMMRRTRRPQS